MSRSPESLPTSAFDYELPADRIAQFPSERRDESRLLVLHRSTGTIEHRRFRDIVAYVNAGDVLVINETKVMPARLLGRKTTGARVEVLLVRPVGFGEAGGGRGVYEGGGTSGEAAGERRGDAGERRGDAAGRAGGAGAAGGEPPGASAGAGGSAALSSLYWEAMVRPGGKLKPGRVVEIGPELIVEIIDRTRDGNRIVRLDSTLPIEEAIARYGRVPLPPYVEREDTPADRERYQTVYARATGSVAAPTAGLHFTPALLDALETKGVALARLVLHVGIGTFRPVEADDPAAHVMHRERYEVPAAAAELMNEARARGASVWAVGTTVVRTIEATTDEAGVTRAGSGETALFIRPPYRFRGVDRLITNFHLPRSTLLMLVAAFGGYEPVMKAYGEAVAKEYRFFSFGDAMAVL